MSRPHNFSNAIKAKVFRLDRATCAYSGTRLWILDHGAAPGFPVDWADHIVPVSGGIGLSIEGNCACADWRANKRKGAKTNASTPLFFRGMPTEHYFRLDENDRAGLADAAYLERFGRLADSDWYFTLGSWQAITGASLPIIGKSLNHKSQQATAIYARLDLDPVRASVEKATAAIFDAVRRNKLEG